MFVRVKCLNVTRGVKLFLIPNKELVLEHLIRRCAVVNHNYKVMSGFRSVTAAASSDCKITFFAHRQHGW